MEMDVPPRANPTGNTNAGVKQLIEQTMAIEIPKIIEIQMQEFRTETLPSLSAPSIVI